MASTPPDSLLLRDAQIDQPPAPLRVLRRWLNRAAPPSSIPESSGEVRAFQPSEEGSGIFGRWVLDAEGLPAYEYVIDQYAEPKAYYPNSENLDRRDHWHQIGNDRVTALASNDGTVQVYLGDRGGVFLNSFASRGDAPYPDAPKRDFFAQLLHDLLTGISSLATRLQIWWRRIRVGTPHKPRERSATSDASPPRGAAGSEPVQFKRELPSRTPARFAYAGGFSYLESGGEVEATAYRYRRDGADMYRAFGMGCSETQTVFRDVRVTRRIYAPTGDHPFLLVEVEFHNRGAQPIDLSAYEYWDVNVHQMKLQWLRGQAFTQAGDIERSALNDLFLPQISFDAAANALRFHQRFMGDADRDSINEIDVMPADIFLADLSGTPDAYYVDKFAFFGSGDARQPEAVRQRYPTIPDAPSTDSMPYCLVMRRDLSLAPNATITQRYAYGTAGASFAFLDPFRAESKLKAAADDWKARLPYFHTGTDAALKREMAWHAYYLLSSTVYNAYHRTHVTPQGSAYLYIHGADGVPRDQALFVLPLVYLRPDLARDNLRLIMSLTHGESGAIPYSFSGHGAVSDAFIHDAPSDLDLFFLLALNEYLAATGDVAFLDEDVPFYPFGGRSLPKGAQGVTVLDHARAAVTHLIDGVGVGAHGLIRVSDGDWSDGVVFENCLKLGGVMSPFWFFNSKADGESIPNTQMALYVLPLARALLASRDPVLAEQIARFEAGLGDALHRQWNGKWYPRAILRDAFNTPVMLDSDRINLESQPWALISGAAQAREVAGDLVKSVGTLLDDPSPTGAMLLDKGMIWPAISQLLTWGYCHAAPDKAWRSLLRNSFAVHAEVFPDNWIGVWSAPDGLYAKSSDQNPGGSWESSATPMTDFPVMNMNPHAMALLGLLRVCGIEPAPAGDGLIIDPHVPRERFTLDTPLIRIDVTPDGISGEYRAIVDGTRALYVRVPPTAASITARVGEVSAEFPRADRIKLTLPLVAGQLVAFAVAWTR